MTKKKIGAIAGIILLIGVMSVAGFVLARSFFERTREVDVLEKEVVELREEQKTQKEYVDYLFTYDWKMYFKKDQISLRYPQFATVCEPIKKDNEIINVRLLFARDVDCAEVEENFSRFGGQAWPLELRQIKNSETRFKSIEDALRAEGIDKTENITTEDSKTKYPHIGGGEFLTEWLSESEKTRYMYAIVIFYPPKPEENYYPPITIIKIPNQIQKKESQFLNKYSFMESYPITELILKSIQFP